MSAALDMTRTDGWQGGRAGERTARRSPRVAIHASVDWKSESNFYTGYTENVSSGGLFLATHKRLPVGTEVELEISLPRGTPFACVAEVRWIRDYNELCPTTSPGMGLQFKQLTSESLETIRSFGECRQSLFMDLDEV